MLILALQFGDGALANIQDCTQSNVIKPIKAVLLSGFFIPVHRFFVCNKVKPNCEVLSTLEIEIKNDGVYWAYFKADSRH